MSEGMCMTSPQLLLRIILIVQATLLGVSGLESLVLGNPLALLIPGLATAGLILAIRRIDRIPTWSRRVIRMVEWTVLVTAAINLLLAIFMNQRLLEPVVIATQVVAPLAVLGLLKRSITPPVVPTRKDLVHGSR